MIPERLVSFLNKPEKSQTCRLTKLMEMCGNNTYKTQIYKPTQ